MGAGGWGREEAGTGWREKLGCSVDTTKAPASPWEVLELGSGAQAFIASASSHWMCVVSRKDAMWGKARWLSFFKDSSQRGMTAAGGIHRHCGSESFTSEGGISWRSMALSAHF